MVKKQQLTQEELESGICYSSENYNWATNEIIFDDDEDSVDSENDDY